MDQIKSFFSFWLKINFREMASNKHFDLRKIENYVRSKCYPEDISKDKLKKANFRKSWKNFKIGHGHHLTNNGKRKVIFDNNRKLLIPQYHSILPKSNIHLRCLNCQQSKSFKCSNKAIPHFFLFTRKFRKHLFTRKKWLPGVFISWEIMTRE